MVHRGAVAIILAAGVGKRLNGWGRPKSLLSFAGSSMLERHVRALRGLAVADIRITGGYQIEAVSEELQRISDPAQLVFNEQFTRGSMLSLHVHVAALRSGKQVLLMDADVLCTAQILKALVESRHDNALLVDMGPVDNEAVKICYANDVIVDFHKRPERAFDRCGESVGFFKLSPTMAAALADRCEHYLEKGLLDLEYETPLRDLMIGSPEAFGAEDITGLPWIEIDVEADLERARREILPELELA